MAAKKNRFSRRDFVVGGGAILAAGAVATCPSVPAASVTAATEKSPYERSKGYLVYDSHRCAGCLSCMLACSLAHEGETSPSLSRIQVSRSVLTRYPYDIQIAVCRQCPDPPCVRNCPTGACHVSKENGFVRMIAADKCLGCQSCIQSCPYHPHRPIWNPDKKTASKCDLCANTPYWGKPGGPGGSQACVSICPMGALKVVSEMPPQTDIRGYDVDLTPPPAPSAPPIPSKPEVSGH